MIDYVFTQAHTLDRVKYQAGDEIQRTPRLGDWLISQGIPLRRKVAAEPVARSIPPPAVSAPETRPTFVARSTPRWCCGNKFRKK